jgi:hypothetical protein
VHPFTPRVTQI